MGANKPAKAISTDETYSATLLQNSPKDMIQVDYKSRHLNLNTKNVILLQRSVCSSSNLSLRMVKEGQATEAGIEAVTAEMRGS